MGRSQISSNLSQSFQGSMVKGLRSFFQRSSRFQGLSIHLRALKKIFQGSQAVRVQGFQRSGFSKTIAMLSSFQGPRVSKVQVSQSKNQKATKFQGCFKGIKFPRASRAKGSHLRVSTLDCTPTYRLLLVACREHVTTWQRRQGVNWVQDSSAGPNGWLAAVPTHSTIPHYASVST